MVAEAELSYGAKIRHIQLFVLVGTTASQKGRLFATPRPIAWDFPISQHGHRHQETRTMEYSIAKTVTVPTVAAQYLAIPTGFITRSQLLG